MTKRSLFLASLCFAACSTEPSATSVPLGEWGGTNAELSVSTTGASALFKCGALGTLDEPLALDRGGSFDVPGTYDPKLVLGGPRAARYRGTVRGRQMTLRLDVGGELVGPYSLTEGSAPSFDACNF
jgi:hypothetical protein